MLHGAKDTVAETVAEIESLLAHGNKRSGRLKPRHIDTKLSRQVARDVKALQQQALQGRQVPYRTTAQTRFARKTLKQVERLVTRDDRKGKRAKALRDWIAGIALNYMIFIMVLVGFWYVATRLN